MKLIIILFFIFFLNYCTVLNKKNDTNKFKVNHTISQDTIKIPNDAFQMDLGFEDAPALVWVKYDKNFLIKEKLYNHIYGINFWNKKGFLYTKYYEQDRESNNKSIKIFEFIIKRYPGDKTLQLIRKNDTILLFNVLENKEFKRTFKGKEYLRLPTVKFNSKEEKVSSVDIEINILKIKDSIYEVTLIDSYGIRNQKFKLNTIIEGKLHLSYYDFSSNKIYLLEKNYFLEKIK